MPQRILVVNDTQEILDTFRILLEEEGYQVVLSSYPIQKANEIERIKPDLIILDFMFGEQKFGWQMLQLLKMQRSTKMIPVIICTAAEKAVREQEGYLVAQGVRVIYKPFDIDMLLVMVKDALKPDHHTLSQTEER